MTRGRDSPTQGGIQMLQLLQVYSQTDRKSRKGLSNGKRFSHLGLYIVIIVLFAGNDYSRKGLSNGKGFSDIKKFIYVFQRNGLTAQPKCAIIQMLSEGRHSKKPLLGKRRSSTRRLYTSGSDVSEPKSKSAHSKKIKKFKKGLDKQPKV